MVLRLIAKIALGVFVGGVLGGIITGDDRYVAAWSIAMPVFIVATVIGGVRGGAKLSGGGLLALARIETIQRTGLEVTVVLIGWALGGNLGLGTVLFAVSIGPVVHVFLPKLTVPGGSALH